VQWHKQPQLNRTQVRPACYASCDDALQLDPLLLPMDHLPGLPEVFSDTAVPYTVKDLMNREEANKLILKIGSVQDASLCAISRYFGELNNDPMFISILEVLSKSCLDILKIATTESVSAIMHRRDLSLAHSNYSSADILALRYSDILGQSALFPPEVLQALDDKLRIANQDLAMNKFIHQKPPPPARSGSSGSAQRPKATAKPPSYPSRGRGRGRGQPAQKQQQKPAPVKRPAPTHVTSAGDAKVAKSDTSSSSSNR